jgi:hypothetical protein
MKYRTQKKFLVMELTEDGLCKHPKDLWGGYVFNQYGYYTEEEAIEAVTKNDYSGYVILPFITKDPVYPED